MVKWRKIDKSQTWLTAGIDQVDESVIDSVNIEEWREVFDLVKVEKIDYIECIYDPLDQGRIYV